jgi:DNA-binding response OmpR family regulator
MSSKHAVIEEEGTVKKVLVIDDEASIARLVASALTAAEVEHQLDYCSDGAQGRIMAARGEHDLITLDLAMPFMDGLEALEQIKRNPKSSGIPVVLLTALQEADLHKRARELGAAAVVTKPCEVWELVSVFRLIVAGGQIKLPPDADAGPGPSTEE